MENWSPELVTGLRPLIFWSKYEKYVDNRNIIVLDVTTDPKIIFLPVNVNSMILQ